MLNRQLLDWIFAVIEDMINDTIEESPEDISTFIAVNDMMNQLNLDISNVDISSLIVEELVDGIFSEIKSNM